jgi:hypothetical protein
VVQFLRADAAVVREDEVCVEKRSGFVVQACAEDFERRRGLSGLWLVSETALARTIPFRDTSNSSACQRIVAEDMHTFTILSSQCKTFANRMAA